MAVTTCNAAASGAATGLRLSRRGEALACFAAAALLLASIARPWIAEAVAPSEDRPVATSEPLPPAIEEAARSGREILIAGYISQPFYYRSDVRMKRPDGTDLTLRRLGWDGDALYFPIDGGIRSMEWWRPGGFMIDFLHNKAISRVGKGAHGRKVANPVIETVEATGTLKGQPVAPRVKLTDVFERLEFTHGHNVLLFTPMLRLFQLTPTLKPYVGVGGGFALPHVEVRHQGEPRETRTNEYQLAGPAAQLVAGVELRSGNWSYFVEYKFTFAWIAAALTGDESWKNFNMPGDLLRQFKAWWRSEPPKLGTLDTRLGAHQIAFGAGYWWRRAK